MDIRRVRLGLGVMTLVAAGTVAVVTAPPAGASARAEAVAAATASPATASPAMAATDTPGPPGTPLAVPGTPQPKGRALNSGQPTPYPMNTLAPLTGDTALPYPAYGTPVPGVNAGSPVPGISATLTLQQAEMIAFARSPVLAPARADVGVQAAQVRLALAGLLPSLSGSAAYDYEHSQPGSFGGTTTTTTGTGVSVETGRTSSTSASFGLALRQLIFDGGRTALGVRAATSAETALADTYRRELQTVAFSVATAYYAYLAAERTTQVDLEIVREDTVQEDLVRAQVRAGTAARSDIATVQLPVVQARVAVVRAQGTELADEAAFVNAMGLDANAKIQPVDDAPVFTANQVSSIPVPPYDTAMVRALALRPDYDAAVQAVNQSAYDLKAARLGLIPTLSAAAAANDNSTDTNAGSFRNSQTIGLSLSIPIYDQGITAANVAAARASLDKAYANLQSTKLGLQLNVKQSLTSLVTARAALDQTQQEYSTAVVNLQATQAQYRAGVTTLPLLLNAQVQLTQALTDQVTSVYTLRQAEQAYLFAVGANYDTSPDIGKTIIRPLPSPEAQGGRTASTGPAKRKNALSYGGTGSGH